MPWTVDTDGTLRQTSAPNDYAAARAKHDDELRNLAQQWSVPWPPTYLTPDGKIAGYDWLQIQRQLASYTQHARHQQDAARFIELLKQCGYIRKEY